MVGHVERNLSRSSLRRVLLPHVVGSGGIREPVSSENRPRVPGKSRKETTHVGVSAEWSPQRTRAIARRRDTFRLGDANNSTESTWLTEPRAFPNCSHSPTSTLRITIRNQRQSLLSFVRELVSASSFVGPSFCLSSCVKCAGFDCEIGQTKREVGKDAERL